MSNDYISKGIVLHRDTWAALDALRKAQGINGKPASYNTVLKSWLAANGASGGSVPRGLADHIAGAGTYQDLGRKGKGIDLDVLRRARKRGTFPAKGREVNEASD